jgi:hypothetical protein
LALLEVDVAAPDPERWELPVARSGRHAIAPATAVASNMTIAPQPIRAL